MSTAALSFRIVSMMGIVLAAAAGDFAVPALWIVGRRLVDVKRCLGVLMGSARAALADACPRLC
jgi:hypothetical protein